MKLMDVYNRQREHFAAEKEWLPTVDVSGVVMRLTPDGWTASCDGLNIRQDSLLWRS
jgi:hypothetical protein